jgi:hypothetical protein
MKTPTPLELRKSCDFLCEKACALAETVETVVLMEWQARGCESALNDLHNKMDVMLEIIGKQPLAVAG